MNDLRHDPDATRPSDAFANVREQFGAYFDAIPDVDAFVREQRGGGDAADDRALRTVDQRIDERLEAIEAALHTQANMLQVLWLEREARGPRP